MKTRLTVTAMLLGGLSLFGAQQADNTAVNKQDRDKSSVTADKQGNSKPDREVARQIRKAIYDEKSLSTYAHNVKIIVKSGQVTLKGPVRTEEEKKAVESIAKQIAGDSSVTSDVSIVPEKK